MLLQALQNKAARLVFARGRDGCSVDLLSSLHWLPVKERIAFKIILYICFQVHEWCCCIISLVSLQSDKYTERRQRLRSSSPGSSFYVLGSALVFYLSKRRDSESVPAFWPCKRTCFIHIIVVCCLCVWTF